MGTKIGVKVWGARGLVSSPHLDNSIYGGNTSCLQIIYKNHLILIDSGFGVSQAGEKIVKDFLKRKEIQVHLFYTHFHWDHTQGLPFFQPIYLKKTRIKIYSPLAPEDVKNNLDVLFDGSYSPFAGIDSMPCEIEFNEIRNNFDLDGIKIDFTPVDHGRDLNNQLLLPTYAYRFDFPEGESLAYITDHEARPGVCNNSIIDFGTGVDLLVHDAQYSESEYLEHVGWGHSSIQQALNNAKKMRAKKVLLTHHDPRRSDLELKNFLKTYKNIPENAEINFDFAKEYKFYDCRTIEKEKPLKKVG